MRSAFAKEVFRSITKSAGRFAAIVIISLLGAGFYGGLRMSAPDMRIAGDEFFDGANLYDICVTTELGVDEGTAQVLDGLDCVGEVMLTSKADAMVSVAGNGYAASFESLPVQYALESDTSDGVNAHFDAEGYLNRPILLEGRWPETAGECVIGADAAHAFNIRAGETLHVVKTQGDLDETFSTEDFVVCGFVNSALFASSSQLGPTSLGSGELELYAFVPDGAFSSDYPRTFAYATVPGARELTWASEEYERVIESAMREVESVAPAIANERLETVKDEVHRQLVGAVQEFSVSLDWADDIETPEVFVMDRSKNPGVASLDSDADGIAQIASLFPFMFFLVAALVSLTSMTRMVDEERLEIGTHKALGYSKGRITSKYLIYGALASGIGSVVGVVVLGKALPWFIMTSYGVSYAVPVYPVPLEFASTVKAVGLSVGVTALATWGAAAASLRERPASLMLPRVPKAGKRIILERIGPLWRRFSFSHKVTARNLLRYKRRFIMAVVGVAGCTALLMVGFGLRDAIGGIVSNQYEQLVHYDAIVRIDTDAPQEQRHAALGALEQPDVADCARVAAFNLVAKKQDGDDLRIEVVVPREPDAIADYVSLRERESGRPAALDDSTIVLTEKAAAELGARTGSSVVLFDENDVGDPTGDGRRFVVGAVVENYLGHFAFMSPSVYDAAFDEPPDFSTTYVKLAEPTDEDARLAFSDRLLALSAVSTVSFVADKIVTYEGMLDVMNKLIFIIVAAAAALAFVVLYNLTNINIEERIREIATLKVLGFTRGEVGAYIFREVFVMSLIGAVAGCILGVPLTRYIAAAAETQQMMFGRVIEPASFILSFALTMLFSCVVAVAMRGKLARVNMVESLKSVE